MKKRKYLLVDASILPDYYEKVIEAKALLSSGKETNVSEVVKTVGISRSTFYKYKDYVFALADEMEHRKAVISCMLSHKAGLLGEVLRLLSEYGANILTISQNMPIHDIAHVTFSIELSPVHPDAEDFIPMLNAIDGVSGAKLISIE